VAGRPAPLEAAPDGAGVVGLDFDASAASRPILPRAGIAEPDPRSYLGRLISYAHATNWGKQSTSREAAMRRAPVEELQLQ
jgi:hypothetical protein